MKTRNIIIGASIGIGLIASFFIGKMIVKKSKDKKAKLKMLEDMNLDLQDKEIDNIDVADTSDFPLKLGSKGQKVREVQMFINEGLKQRKKPTITVDGQWGSQTNSGWKALGKDFDQIDERQYKIIKAYLMKQIASKGVAGAISGASL